MLYQIPHRVIREILESWRMNVIMGRIKLHEEKHKLR